MILVKSKHNYADEYDVNGFAIFTESEFIDFIAAASETFANAANANETISASWGGNDQMEFETFKDYKEGLEIVHISNEAAKEIIDIFGKTYGSFLYAEW